MSSIRFLFFDGRSYTYDHRANGYTQGEGIACLLLKPLANALRDGDTIRAIIRNIGCNQDDRTPSITFPSASAQASLMRYEQVNLNQMDTPYVETHGTGTQAGDLIDASAFFEIFGKGRISQPLLTGSIKTNIGHLEGASGVAGLAKVVQMLENEMIPGN